MKFDWIVNKLKERIYPYTHADAVIMDDEETKLSDKFTDIDEHLADTALHVPASGEVGQILIKTEDGSDWTAKDDVFILKNQTLLFNNLLCTIEDSRITSDSLADVYFTSDTIDIAETAKISVETYSGNLQLIAEQLPTGDIKATIVIRGVE